MSDANRRDLTELVAVILLAFAAVATAWSSYQANRWNGEQAKTSGRVNATRIDAARASGLANAQTQVDIATFVQWVDAYAQQKTKLADFYEKRFRKEFQPAFQAWLATRPLRNADAPLTPFAMPDTGSRRPRTPNGSMPRRRCSPPRFDATSSARPTTS